MHAGDRQVIIQLMNAQALIVQMLGSRANVLQKDADDAVVDSFLKKSNSPAASLDVQAVLPTAMELAHIAQDVPPETPFGQVLKKIFPQFGSVLTDELMHRLGIQHAMFFSDCSAHERERAINAGIRLRDELMGHPQPRIYYDGTKPIRLAVIPLHLYEQNTFQSFETVSEAVQVYRNTKLQEKAGMKELERLNLALSKELEHIERTLEKISGETVRPQQADEYEHYGKLLMAQLHLVKKGDATAILEDVLKNSHALVEIPIDPHLNPVKNAERYFEKSRKAKHTMEEQQLRTAELHERHAVLVQLSAQLPEVSTHEELERFIQEHRRELDRAGVRVQAQGKKSAEPPPPFRVFTVAGGFQVWAGKSGENNDLLSTRYTAKNDLWFHARGVGGSHVVLKMGTGKGEVSKQAIEQAAGIAAYYSKMKSSSLVPVSMCEGKYVRKPKGVPAGTVTIEREKTIFAVPALPHVEQS